MASNKEVSKGQGYYPLTTFASLSAGLILSLDYTLTLPSPIKGEGDMEKAIIMGERKLKKELQDIFYGK
jgi:hypothetical protein